MTRTWTDRRPSSVAPSLTALAKESLYLANNYEPTHLGSTADAEFAVMQSLYPLPVGVVASRYARLAERTVVSASK